MISELRQHGSKNLESQILFVSKAISPSLDDTNLVVQSFYKSQRHFVFRSAVSGNAIRMTLDHLGKFLVGPKPLPFERHLPVLKEAYCPAFALIAPQLTKGLLEQVSGVESLVHAEQRLQGLASFETEVLPARQQRVLLSLDKASVFARKPPVFAFSHLIQRLAQMTHHMKLVVQNSSLRRARLGGISKRLPHIHHRQANPIALWLSQLVEELPHALLGTVRAAEPDRSSSLQVANDNPISVPFANRHLVDANHFRSWLASLGQLRLHVLLVQLFNRVPVQLEFLSHVLDGRRATPPPHIIGKALGVKRIVRQKLQSLALHFATAWTQYSANLELQVHSRIAARQISNLANPSVVPTVLHFAAAAAGRFFERRTRLTMRALGSPKTPRTVGVGRNPMNAYVSHNRLARFVDLAMEIPCRFSFYSQSVRSLFPCGSEPVSSLTIYPLDYAMSHKKFVAKIDCLKDQARFKSFKPFKSSEKCDRRKPPNETL